MRSLSTMTKPKSYCVPPMCHRKTSETKTRYDSTLHYWSQNISVTDRTSLTLYQFCWHNYYDRPVRNTGTRRRAHVLGSREWPTGLTWPLGTESEWKCCSNCQVYLSQAVKLLIKLCPASFLRISYDLRIFQVAPEKHVIRRERHRSFTLRMYQQ